MFNKSETPTLGGSTPKINSTRPPEIKISRSISKAISWRMLGTLDTLIISFVLITFIGPFFGLQPENKEALEIASLIAITEVVTKMVFYFLHERVWAKIVWGVSSADGGRAVEYRRTIIKTVSWRVIATTDTIALAWFYTGNLATALSIGSLEIFTKLILYFLHERLWTKIPFGIHQGETVICGVSQEKKGDIMTEHTQPTSKKLLAKRRAHSRWDNEGGTIPARPPRPYRTTQIYNEITLPKGLRRKHKLASGVWGIIKVLEGRVSYKLLEPLSQTFLDSKHPGRVIPNQAHRLEVVGLVRLKVEFYDKNPFVNM